MGTAKDVAAEKIVGAVRCAAAVAVVVAVVVVEKIVRALVE